LLSGYAIQGVAMLGQSLPNRPDGVFTSDFEPGGINNRGQIVFTGEQGKPDQANDQGEGIFLTGSNGSPIQTLALPGQSVPGGTLSGFGSLSPDGINDRGDAAFGYTLNGDVFPIIDAGVFRYSHQTGKLTEIETPGVTALRDGTKLVGAAFQPSINNSGDIAFIGIIPTTKGADPSTGMGEGLFVSHANGTISTLIVPGDPAPGGSTFDSAELTSINDEGDVAFGAHVAADPQLGADFSGLGPYQSVYVRWANGAVQSIAHQGAAIPASAGGGWFDVAYNPTVNDFGQIAFTAAISKTKPTGDPSTDDPTTDGDGVFLWSHRKLIDVARPGDAVPGGAHIVSTSFLSGQSHLNNLGQVVFNATLDDGTQGVFVWSNGQTRLVAKTGTSVPGVGTISGLDLFGYGFASTWATNNDRGQVTFAAALQGGGEALLLANPQVTTAECNSHLPDYANAGSATAINDDGIATDNDDRLKNRRLEINRL